ncbi:unnamed protein product [Closterium sp. NIES-53]
MAFLPYSVPLRVPLPPPTDSSLPAIHDPESDLARATIPTVSRLLATVVTDHLFESTAASALEAEPPAPSLRSLPDASQVARHTEDYTCGSWV